MDRYDFLWDNDTFSVYVRNTYGDAAFPHRHGAKCHWHYNVCRQADGYSGYAEGGLFGTPYRGEILQEEPGCRAFFKYKGYGLCVLQW